MIIQIDHVFCCPTYRKVIFAKDIRLSDMANVTDKMEKKTTTNKPDP